MFCHFDRIVSAPSARKLIGMRRHELPASLLSRVLLLLNYDRDRSRGRCCYLRSRWRNTGKSLEEVAADGVNTQWGQVFNVPE